MNEGFCGKTRIVYTGTTLHALNDIMQRALFYMVLTAVAAGVGSMLYFLCLVAGLGHLLFAAPVVLCGGAGVFVLANRFRPDADLNKRVDLASMLILSTGLATLIWRSVPEIQKYGGWDAWAMWNFHARFLQSPQYWTMMFDNGARAHPDYPLFIPATIAFLSRLCGGSVETVSYTIHLAITLAIPSLIFLRYRAANIVVASAALLLLATDKHYIAQGISMYADTALPFFVLCALISLETMADKKWASFIAALALGCCMWTKNEGLMMASVFMVVYPRGLFRDGAAKYFIAGISLPLLTLIVFKFGYAPANDMVSGVSQSAFSQLTDAARYKLIFGSLVTNVKLHFSTTAWCLAALVLVCIIARRLPDRSILFVVMALVGYMIAYALTYLDLEWHLHTSFERLLHQLKPIAVYSVAATLSALPVPGRLKME